jgi:hypothetical protein
MSSIIKVNTYQDANGNALFSSDGSGNVTLTNFPDNTPAFRARLSSNQSVSGSTWTVLSLATEDFDIGSYFDTSTYRWTPPSGRYVINGQVRLSTGMSYMYVAIYKNGTTEQVMAQIDASSAGIQNISGIIEPNGTDYYDLRCYLASSGTVAAGYGFTFMGGYKLIGA